VTILGIWRLYTFLTNMVTWTMGANRTAAEAGRRGCELPEIFGLPAPRQPDPDRRLSHNRRGFHRRAGHLRLHAGSAEDLFWTLFAFSSIVFWCPTWPSSRPSSSCAR
jgi:hypothetical protein